MTFAEAIAHLQSLGQFGFQPGLGTTLALAESVGNPQLNLRFIHVAGTNGKGSTCAMLENIYRQSGLRVGLYTSPHLVRFGERIQVNRIPIPDQDLARLTSQLSDIVTESGIKPTFFEFTTVLALCWFAESECDLVIWETGLGGRLDATNIVIPLVSIITNIGWDHMHVLGNSLTAIATEKAGIIKPGVPVIALDSPTEARAVIEQRARELGAPYHMVGSGEIADFDFEVGLLGKHQRANAALAIAAVATNQRCIPVTNNALRQGLKSVAWMGRLQLVRRGRQTVLLDGAHNRDGIVALRAALAELDGATCPVVIVGFLVDKEWQEMARLVADLAAKVWTVPVASSRTLPPEQLAEAISSFAPSLQVRASSSFATALAEAETESFLLITGSLYLIGEAIERLGILSGSSGDQRSLNEWGGGRSVPSP